MRISDWSSDVCSSDLEALSLLVRGDVQHHLDDEHPSVDQPLLERVDRVVAALDLILVGEAADPADQHVLVVRAVDDRSEERRVGKECVSTCRSRWSTYHSKKTTIIRSQKIKYQ